MLRTLSFLSLNLKTLLNSYLYNYHSNKSVFNSVLSGETSKLMGIEYLNIFEERLSL